MHDRPVGHLLVKEHAVPVIAYGGLRILNDDASAKLTVGSFCSIGDDVTFLLGLEHHLDYVSTFPYKHFFCNQDYEAFSKGDIIIEDDVWIGHGSIILSNVHIGQGAVIAAGSVVTKNVPAYSVVGGSPAKIIKYRFDKETISELLKIDYSLLNKEVITNNVELFYQHINGSEKARMIKKTLFDD